MSVRLQTERQSVIGYEGQNRRAHGASAISSRPLMVDDEVVGRDGGEGRSKRNVLNVVELRHRNVPRCPHADRQALGWTK